MDNDNHTPGSNPGGNPENYEDLSAVAIIGLAGRFPGARNIDELWSMLTEGVEGITTYDDEELIGAGIDPEVLKNPNYVKVKGEVADVDMFDADFFGMNPREAEVTDPQHRMLMECAQDALEHAGYDSSKFDGRIGVYAGEAMNYYLLLNVYPRIKKEISAGSLQAAVGNDKDSLTTTISYHLNLTGPSITVQTSSSTSLVSVCVAVQGLLAYQSDIALAGGITAGPPIKCGYKYEDGNIWAPDGHCRPYSDRAQGFVPAAGMGLVVLKRLEEAVADGDTIWAVIRGSAVNNDGNKKVSYHAPSVDAQAEVVAEALAVADIHPETVQYIEGHGTGTNLGDPIEITALTQAYRAYTGKKQYCAIGSIKSNIGHLDNAAGVTGLIKATLCLKHKKMVPTLHYEKPNPKIDFENSPFFVNTGLKDWETGAAPGVPRRAGVTSLGMGGTNAHVVLEESPVQPPIEGRDCLRPYHMYLLSARTPTALDQKGRDLAGHLESNPGVHLDDVGYTLAVGRGDLARRRFVLAKGGDDAVEHLRESTPGRAFDHHCTHMERPVVFMFSGQGTQYVDMAKDLYLHEPLFKEHMDNCAEILKPLVGLDVRKLIYPGFSFPGEDETANPPHPADINQTWLTQPVLVMIEYSLAQLWQHWGITPDCMIGHSIGEFTAACTAGVMSLEDTLRVVAERGRLMQSREAGAMLSVDTEEARLIELLGDRMAEVSLAAVNSPKHCVLSGTFEAVDAIETVIKDAGLYCRRLHTSHAFHSPMMEPAKQAFEGVMADVDLQAPRVPFISCVSGKWITGEEAVSPAYWADQLRQGVRFSDGIAEIVKDPARVLLEVGPGNSLCLLAKQHKDEKNQDTLISSLRHIKQTDPDTLFLLKALGKLWLLGAAADWNRFYEGENRRRIPLPSYPFERKRYWLEAPRATGRDAAGTAVDTTGDTAGEPSESGAADTPVEEEKAGRSFQKRPAMNNEYVTPENDTQREIVEIWEDILSIKPIGIEDNFFDLGGHSLLATLFLSRLQEQFNIRLELRSIFESPTISAIAVQLAAQKGKETGVSEVEDILDEIEGLPEEGED